MSSVVCKRCISDTTIPSISFDAQGVCNFCHAHDRMGERYKNPQKELEALLSQIKKSGARKSYDCIIGFSGGTDSSFCLHKAKELGLRPLAVHFDNGWNTPESVTNIKLITEKLGIDLHTYVVDWDEFKSLQSSFLKAAVPCIEAPTDVAIHAVLFKTAAEEGVKYILGGQSFKTEGTVPREWSYLDGTYIESVHREFGADRLRSFPNLSLQKIFYYTFIKGIRNIPFLNYFDYRKKEGKNILKTAYGWQDYSGHHYENTYSRFAFGWYLPKKFKIDKRIVSLSGPVRSGHISREQALDELRTPPDVDDKLLEYVINKLGISPTEYQRLLALPNKTYRDYLTSASFLKFFEFPVRIAVKMNVFTPVLYEKYFK